MRPRWRLVELSYQDIYDRACGLAGYLQHKGVVHQDRVILIATNSPFWGCAYFGTLLAGGIVIPLNPQSTPEFIDRIIKETEAKIILKSSSIELPPNCSIESCDIDVKNGIERLEPGSEIAVTPDDIAQIVYTSGTTGEPKGVVLTHNNIMSCLDSIHEIIEASPSDRMVSVLPLFHVYEQVIGLLGAMRYGVSIMYAPNISSKAIGQTLREFRATKMLVVPELLESIMHKIEHRAEEAGKTKLLERIFKISSYLPYVLRRLLFRRVHNQLGGKLRIVACGGAALPEELEEQWSQMGFIVLQGYGLTETSPVVSTNTEKNRRIGSVGKVVTGVTVTISEDKEIRVQGQNVFGGYYKNEQQTKEVFDEQGRFRTGDLGEFDKDDFLFIKGRLKYMIVTARGENVYPEDLEEALKEVEGVTDAAVVGRPENGHLMIHAVLLGEIKDGQAIIDQANGKLARHQQIQEWSVWPEADFPRSATRKVKKNDLLAWLEKAGVTATQQGGGGELTPLIKLLGSISRKDPATISAQTCLMRDLHLDSLMRIELVGRIEENFDIEVQEQQITHETTVADLEKLIGEGKKPTIKRVVKKWLLSRPVRLCADILQRCIFFPLYRLFVSIKVEGLENLKDIKGPVIFMPNHLSYADPLFVLKSLPGPLRRKTAMAAALDVLYEQYWYLAWFIEFLFNTYPLARKETDNIKPGLETTGVLLDKGFSILLFPEGKISVDGNPQELKKGTGLIATEMDVPIVPIILKDVQTYFPYNTLLPRKRGEITIRFGAPIQFDAHVSYEDARINIQENMNQILKNLFEF